MSKRRALLGIILDLVLLVTIIWTIIRTIDNEAVFEYLKLGQYIAPMILGIVVLLHILSLIHSFNSGKGVNSFVSSLMLIAGSAEIVVMLIKVLIVIPYRHSFDIDGLDYSIFIMIPVLTFVSFLPSNHKYSPWGLLYSNIGMVGYFGTVITLSKLNIIESPYRFINVDLQKIYKLIINIAILIAANTFVSGILMLISKPKKN